ncbi:uncharacterized protein LOC112684793 [Sipha flava]|uniref:DDB1-and CUL4-associated factor 15 n=1 Tax=Sipha flava TaxID=143950 RepID=A0A2S2PXX3_9HEMI|nr:uncharacterized protein LOC112684793 [Sipha flava]
MSISSDSIIHKLYNRQVHGTFKYKYNPQNNARYLFKKNPDWCTFLLSDIIKDMSDHVLMGFTRCGRFLLTYTCTVAETETVVIDSPIISSSNIKYKLHFWAFRPGQKAFKVTEVSLFENADHIDLLNVYIVQWPNRSDRVVVFGESVISEDDECDMHKIYITVTTLPSLNNCIDCRSVAYEHRHEDFSKYYSGNTCLVHGLTVHTLFTVSHPYPSLEPYVLLKYDDHIVLNTCNFIHVLNIDLDQNQDIESDKTENINAPLAHKLSNDLTEFGYKMANKSDNQERGIKRRHIESRCFFDKEQDLTISALNPIPNYNSHRLLRMKDAEKIYDFDENDDSCMLKFKWFRRRRIADKMYEFCSEEEDMENVHPSSKKSLCQRCESPGPSAVDQTPLYIHTDYEDDRLNDCDRKMLIAQELNAIIADWDCLSSPRSVTSEDRDLKSPDIANRKITNVLKPRNKTPLTKNSKNACDKKVSVMLVPDNNTQGSQSNNVFLSVPLQGCSVKLERRYIEVDEEIVSVSTDLDEEDGLTGSLCALPLSVHGSASAQMQMVNTTKIGKQEKNVCVIKQASLDFEHVSYKVAEIICNLEGHKFWCYNDYDSAIIDICPLNGDILIALCIRLNTEEEKRPIPICQSESSRGFETKCVILWNPKTDTCYLEAYWQLEAITEDSSTSWNPARHEANILRQAPLGFFNVPAGRQVKCLSHEIWSRHDGYLNPSLFEIRDEENMITILRNRILQRM